MEQPCRRARGLPPSRVGSARGAWGAQGLHPRLWLVCWVQLTGGISALGVGQALGFAICYLMQNNYPIYSSQLLNSVLQRLTRSGMNADRVLPA